MSGWNTFSLFSLFPFILFSGTILLSLYHHRHHLHRYHWSNGIYMGKMRSQGFFVCILSFFFVLSFPERIVFRRTGSAFLFLLFSFPPFPPTPPSFECVWLSCKIASLCSFFVCAWSNACACACVYVDCCPCHCPSRASFDIFHAELFFCI